MKKNVKKLALAKETLRNLEMGKLEGVAGVPLLTVPTRTVAAVLPNVGPAGGPAERSSANHWQARRDQPASPAR
jgi:hypothetical protein